MIMIMTILFLKFSYISIFNIKLIFSLIIVVLITKKEGLFTVTNMETIEFY